MLKTIIRHSLVDGIALTATSSLALMLASFVERGSPWSAINPICHMIDGDERDYGDEFDSRDTLLGLAANCSAMLAWAALHQTIFGRVKFPASLAAGAATTAGAYCVDYHLVPKRFTPGIEKKISGRSITLIYTVFALTLGIMALARGSADDPHQNRAS